MGKCAYPFHLLDTHSVQSAKFLISQQKYLELLEARKTASALQILREELAPLSVEPDQLHSLSRYATSCTGLRARVL